MQRTRITVSLLVGVAVTTLSGCVSVQSRPDVPPRPRASGPTQDLAPQIVLPPVHDTLEAVPAPEPSASASRPANGAPPDTRRAAPRAPLRQRHQAATRPRPHRAPAAATAPVPAPPAKVAGTDVCALGRGYGRWPAGSPQSRICDDTYGH
ncbi:hypothetical protein OG978_07100 [Streptomyces sp. NBC_01591]|uniref:hypothetical protein n=1 Tax=Streptomyces sp. NBC_01591 TaxID=2975888 RepID=UPI002DD80251|nr:hypothetical protein [Streptomyces sp. NBC_01591]WSD67169.1 hypothetical protein OG978_07100 [Streptomyces sp. NBC_01591]